MADGHPVSGLGEITMTLLGDDIPAIGPKLKTRQEALSTVNKYVRSIERMVEKSHRPYKVMFVKQKDGRYALQIRSSGEALEILQNLDELTVRRFQKSFKSRLFIITSFCEQGDQLECLALTEGMGAVLYIP